MREREERVTELFRRHADDIHAYAVWRVGRQDAADVVGEVFLVAWRSLDRVRAGEERGWLFGVARRVVLAHRRQGTATAVLDERMVTSTVAQDGPDRLADDVALRDQVRRALDALGERDREVLVTAAWFDLTAAEAARVLGVSRPTYAVRLHRARTRFRVAYQRIAEDSGGASPTVRKPVAA
ncbi:sigma-70 family RNA polymerase sigma factor [Plantactinospora sp. S1510]|uniref:Sigma-70 family RNA polymerase sigma factor n=1 Tax=Plantactinospora alkalitolerans TaxID=2789879 RepID=A0ABS0GWR3_9ACTN|nr:sigma-70 family RNA polymerase sigma factor [Plantactinospora alkalitolerans]MBF9130655.1 sigma-70 family RNA polymerase sigma factor [Plantactinospora alkalitolerans]